MIPHNGPAPPRRGLEGPLIPRRFPSSAATPRTESPDWQRFTAVCTPLNYSPRCGAVRCYVEDNHWQPWPHGFLHAHCDPKLIHRRKERVSPQRRKKKGKQHILEEITRYFVAVPTSLICWASCRTGQHWATLGPCTYHVPSVAQPMQPCTAQKRTPRRQKQDKKNKINLRYILNREISKLNSK